MYMHVLYMMYSMCVYVHIVWAPKTVYVCIYICISIHTYISIHVYVYIYIHLSTYILTHFEVQSQDLSFCTALRDDNNDDDDDCYYYDNDNHISVNH